MSRHLTKQDLVEALQPVVDRLDAVEGWLGKIEADVAELKPTCTRSRRSSRSKNRSRTCGPSWTAVGAPLPPRRHREEEPLDRAFVKLVKAALRIYEKEVKESPLKPNAKKTLIQNARSFVRWLDGDFTPGATLEDR